MFENTISVTVISNRGARRFGKRYGTDAQDAVRIRLAENLKATVSQRLLRRTDGITRLRGRRLEYRLQNSEKPPIPAIATFHPAYLLRNTMQKRLAWRDFLSVSKRLRDA